MSFCDLSSLLGADCCQVSGDVRCHFLGLSLTQSDFRQGFLPKSTITSKLVLYPDAQQALDVSLPIHLVLWLTKVIFVDMLRATLLDLSVPHLSLIRP